MNTTDGLISSVTWRHDSGKEGPGREAWSLRSASHIHNIDRKECGFLNLGMQNSNTFSINALSDTSYIN